MKNYFASVALAVAAVSGAGNAHADTVKIGVIGTFSGPFALEGKNFKAGIDAYFALKVQRSPLWSRRTVTRASESNCGAKRFHR